jgi:catechol 2,3-dioxygenase-like lactoylglutathione lyase family enzyme
MAIELDSAVDALSNVVALEHVNVRVSDQRKALAFYVDGLGLTRDPELMTGSENMWINVGRSQFHLPTGEPQVLRGQVGLVLPDRGALLERLADLSSEFAATDFSFSEGEGYVDVSSPWGNRLRCFDPDDRLGDIGRGMAYVSFDVPVGTAAGIARFYREMLDAQTEVEVDDGAVVARCAMGSHQRLIFRETDAEVRDYDGHHVQIYLAGTAGPFAKLEARGLAYEKVEHQYRFKDIVDLDDGKVLFTIEHEVRSTSHPLYGRQLVNRSL